MVRDLPRESLLDYPPIIARRGILHTLVDVRKPRRPFKVPMLMRYRRLLITILLLDLSFPNPLLVLISTPFGILNSLKAATRAPVILQHLRPEDLLVLNILHKRHIHRVHIGIRIPICH